MDPSPFDYSLSFVIWESPSDHGRPLGGQPNLGVRSTQIRIQVVLGQGSADLLMIVVVLVHDASPLPSPNGVPFQSAAFAAHAGDVEPPCGMRLVGSVSRNHSLLNRYRKAAHTTHYGR